MGLAHNRLTEGNNGNFAFLSFYPFTEMLRQPMLYLLPLGELVRDHYSQPTLQGLLSEPVPKGRAHPKRGQLLHTTASLEHLFPFSSSVS